MVDVQRYRVGPDYSVEAAPFDAGKWVKFDDHAALLADAHARIAGLEAERDAALLDFTRMVGDHERALKRADAAEREVQFLRSERPLARALAAAETERDRLAAEVGALREVADAAWDVADYDYRPRTLFKRLRETLAALRAGQNVPSGQKLGGDDG
jgi:hypothetical protein